MLTIENLTTFHINKKHLEKITEELTSREVDLTICYNDTIQTYNREYRNIDRATDVLSFPIENEINLSHDSIMPLGSIVVSIEYVKERAVEFNHGEDDELTLLFIHGLLHLLGYDHEVDSGEMRVKEEELINQFHLPKSLIVRTEDF